MSSEGLGFRFAFRIQGLGLWEAGVGHFFLGLDPNHKSSLYSV